MAMGGNEVKRIRWVTPTIRRQVRTTREWTAFLANVAAIYAIVGPTLCAVARHAVRA